MADFESALQGIPGHNYLQLRQELLALGLLLGCRLFVVRESELIAAHQSSSGLRSHGYFGPDRPGFPGPP